MLNKIKSWWFHVKKRKMETDSVYHAIGLTHQRMDELAEEVSYLFGNVEKTSDVIDGVSKKCRSNAELISLGMMVNCVVNGLHENKKKSEDKKTFIDKNQKSVRVHEIENSQVLHVALGIDRKRADEIAGLVTRQLSMDNKSFCSMMEVISVFLKHPNELVLAMSFIQLTYQEK